MPGQGYGGLASINIQPLLPFQGKYSGIETLGDVFNRRGGGNFGVPEDEYLPWDYNFGERRNMDQWGQPNQHFGLPPLNSFPEFRPGISEQDMYPHSLPGDLSLGDWIPYWDPEIYQQWYGQNQPTFFELLKNLQQLFK